jgi:hypothetical protein
MPISPLTDLYIDETYPRLVQTNDTRTEFADGLGNPITFGTTNTGSLLTTASVSLNTITFTKGDGSTFPIVVNTGSAATVTGYVTTSSFNAFTSSVVPTSSFNNYTGSTTSQFAGTASFAQTASFVKNAQTASYVLQAVSASFATTASFTPNALTTASVSSNVITFTKGNGTTFALTVNTGSGGGGGAAFPYTGSAGISGSLLVNGRVGIGTTTPFYALDVSNSARLGGIITSASSTVSFITSIRNSLDINTSASSGERGVRIYAANTLTTSPGGAAIQFFSNDTLYYPGQFFMDSGANDNAALIFRTAQTSGTITERMRVASDGRVGIGTNSPAAKVDVRGGAHFGTGTPTGYIAGGQHTVEITATGVATNLTLIGGSATTEIWVDDTPTKAIAFGAALPGVAADGDWHFSTYTTTDSWNDRMVIKNDTGNVGIGTNNPLVKLHVQGGSGAMGMPYEIAAFERNGDTKFGVYTSVDAFNDGGASITMGATTLTNNSGYHPGYEFQFTPTATPEDNFIRYNYLNRQTGSGAVAGATTDLFNIYADGKVTINGTDFYTGINVIPRLGIGTSSPSTTLDVISDTQQVAHFDGFGGYPIEIWVTDEPLTEGYAAPQGSIGNGAGTLYLKTGSANVDWAPIVYKRGPMPERTFPGIDLSVNPLSITSPGIYEITTATGNKIFFPDPTPLDGQKVTVVNADGSNQADIGSTYAPYDRGNASQLTSIGGGGIWQFVSIGGKWRGLRG